MLFFWFAGNTQCFFWFAGDAPNFNYKIMNNEYTIGYYLIDGIYPDRATLVKSIKEKNGQPLTKKYSTFTKDIERAFGICQARFAIGRGPACFWDKKKTL
jgi:hypothetical protein